MNVGTRLALFAAGLVAVFGTAYAAGAVVVPDDAADAWRDASADDEHAGADHADGHGGTGGAGVTPAGLSASQDGFRLDGLSAPTSVGADGVLSFRVLGVDGAAVTAYETVHDEELHLVVVRTDGAHFRHVHPDLDDDGTWSLPWSWPAAGTYRVYVDAAPSDGPALVLGGTLTVAGDLEPVEAAPTRDAVAGEYEVYLAGNLLAGGTSELTAQVRRDGRPVEDLQPYLGALGHLVALRADDLAYLHVHPTGPEPDAGATSGPDVAFEAHVDTVGRYLLYLDLRVDDEVRTFAFVVDAVADEGGSHTEGESHDHEH
ncbi:heavy-metal-associated domain-containing protein [Nocardioides zeae]|uniref:Heavy-metal-associated domain-containing protein n=1 Tax=Nocardioides imazamoxiresistens TaxID=3231893 RepID=A0ABU3Q0E4_9ACTN|nr:heavy-metal-associated domain-containing protein [Nocardioides zeae]MDT9594939.1 heavy-metal-associated domain-containing protein [Nocardioides zeae]